MKAAPDIAIRDVQVTAGIDENQLRAAYELHCAFAAEQGLTLDGEAWAAEIKAAIEAGSFNLGIAWDGDAAVGVTEMHVEYDPLLQKRIAWGRRAYVLPEYRQADVFTALFNFGVIGSDFLGIPFQRAIANTDWYGAAMRKFYESQGFKLIGYVMEREA